MTHSYSNPIRLTRCRIARFGGFTLVELLVVVAVMGTLIAMLLPAVSACRETARRNKCLGNMSQLSLAIHNYEFQFQHLPAGVIAEKSPVTNVTQDRDISWIVLIAPFVEEQPLFRRFDMKGGAYAAQNAFVRAARIDIIVCPSDVTGVANPTRTFSSYAGCHHDVEAPIAEDNHGLLFLNSRVRIADIVDGTSKTLLLGEKWTRQDDLGWVSGTPATLRNTGQMASAAIRPNKNAPAPARFSGPENLFVGDFDSHHTGGGIISAFADGSCHYLSVMDADTWRRLGHRADRELVRAESDY